MRAPSRGIWHSDPARFSTIAILVLMILQFLTGMGLNLFVIFPDAPNPNLSDMVGAMLAGLMPAVHLVVAFMIFILSVVVLAILVDSGESKLVTLAVVGLASVTLSGLSGLGFVYSGFQSNLDSYMMAIGFISAFVSYFALAASHKAWP